MTIFLILLPRFEQYRLYACTCCHLFMEASPLPNLSQDFKMATTKYTAPWVKSWRNTSEMGPVIQILLEAARSRRLSCTSADKAKRMGHETRTWSAREDIQPTLASQSVDTFGSECASGRRAPKRMIFSNKNGRTFRSELSSCSDHDTRSPSRFN